MFNVLKKRLKRKIRRGCGNKQVAAFFDNLIEPIKANSKSVRIELFFKRAIN